MDNKIIKKIMNEFDAHDRYRASFVTRPYNPFGQWTRNEKIYNWAETCSLIKKDMEKRAKKIIKFLI